MRLFATGKRITQPQYGPGTIISTDERYTVIEFDDHGRRRFITTMVTLEPTTVAAPERAATAARRRKAARAAAPNPVTP